MNFEFNCVGTCLATSRKGKYIDVIPLSPNHLEEIERFSSLGREPFGVKEGETHWELTVKIPFRLLGVDPFDLPQKLMVNFYKCGDATAVPHYVSWSPIPIASPDFHRPEYFGEISFT